MLKVMTVPASLPDLPAHMRAVAEGDRRAFHALVQHLYGPGMTVALRVLGDRAEAEDAVQTAFLKLWRQARLFDPARGNVQGWFYRLLVNCCLDRRRMMKPVVMLDEAIDVADSAPLPDALAEQSGRASAVNAAVSALNPRQRAAIALFYGDGASMAEIADILDTTPKAVEGLLARARQVLADTLMELQA